MLSRAEQIAALFRGGMDVDDIAATVGVQRPYALHCLTDAGLRRKAHVPLACLNESELPPRVNRDPCSYCNVRADIGCRHSRIAA